MGTLLGIKKIFTEVIKILFVPKSLILLRLTLENFPIFFILYATNIRQVAAV